MNSDQKKTLQGINKNTNFDAVTTIPTWSRKWAEKWLTTDTRDEPAEREPEPVKTPVERKQLQPEPVKTPVAPAPKPTFVTPTPKPQLTPEEKRKQRREKIWENRAKNNTISMYWQILRGNLTAIEAAIRHGADVNERGEEDKTPLEIAAEYGKTKVVKYLLKNGAKVDTTTANKNTPLLLAARNGRLQTVKILIDAGSDINARDKDGNTSLDLARKNEYPNVVALLERSGAEANTTRNSRADSVQRHTEALYHENYTRKHFN